MHSLSVFILTLLAALSVQAAVFQSVDGKFVPVTKPQRIVALNSSTVEILFDLGRQSLIVGTDVGAQYPEDAKALAKVGHPYRPSVEGIISLKPDLVLATEENLPAASAEQLRSAKIPVLVLENSAKDGLEGLKWRITEISKVTEAEKEGQALIAAIDKKMAAVKAAADKQEKPLNIFFLYAHGPKEAFVYGRETGSHELIQSIGARNAADFTTGTKPLTAEAMVQASPDVIIMLGRGLKAVGGVEGALKLPGVKLTPAGKNRRIVEVDDSIRWISPRFPDFADKLLRDIYK